MVLKSDKKVINKLVTKHKCSEELRGPLPDDETSMNDQNLRMMKHVKNEDQDNHIREEIKTISYLNKEADVILVSGFDRHSIKVNCKIKSIVLNL